MRKIFEGILVNLVEKWGVDGVSGMRHHLTLVSSLLFDQNQIKNLHLDILV